jgi:hypothetical protein
MLLATCSSLTKINISYKVSEAIAISISLIKVERSILFNNIKAKQKRAIEY